MRLVKQICGGLLVVVGCAILLLLLRGMFRQIGTIWNVVGDVLLVSLLVYVCLSGLRMMNPSLVRRPRFGWGKIIVGLFVLYSQAMRYFHLFPDGPIPELKPANPTQAASMKVTMVAICLLFAYVIYRGIRQGFPRSAPQQGVAGRCFPEQSAALARTHVALAEEEI